MLIDVNKNPTTGKYEVETDVKPTPGGGAIAYAWDYEDDLGGGGIAYFNFDVAPEDGTEFETKRRVELADDFSSSIVNIYPCLSDFGYSKQSNTQFYIDGGRSGTTYTRADSSKDIDIWTYTPESEEG